MHHAALAVDQMKLEDRRQRREAGIIPNRGSLKRSPPHVLRRAGPDLVLRRPRPHRRSGIACLTAFLKTPLQRLKSRNGSRWVPLADQLCNCQRLSACTRSCLSQMSLVSSLCARLTRGMHLTAQTDADAAQQELCQQQREHALYCTIAMPSPFQQAPLCSEAWQTRTSSPGRPTG